MTYDLLLFKNSNLTWDPIRGDFGNRQLWDLGFEVTATTQRSEVTEKIEQLEEDFDQVLILEHLDEGLVMMANNLCWTLEKVERHPLQLSCEFNPMLGPPCNTECTQEQRHE